MKRVRHTSWDTLVLVCRKCAKAADVDLRGTLRDEVRAEGSKGRVRVVATSCLDVCPKGAVAVAVACPGEPLRTFVVPRRARKERVLRRLLGGG